MSCGQRQDARATGAWRTWPLAILPSMAHSRTCLAPLWVELSGDELVAGDTCLQRVARISVGHHGKTANGGVQSRATASSHFQAMPVRSKNPCGLALVVCGAHQKVGSRTRWLRMAGNECGTVSPLTQWWEKHSAIRPTVWWLFGRFPGDQQGWRVYFHHALVKTARLGSPSRQWNSWRSWLPWCLCSRRSTWCSMGAVLAPHSSLRGAITPTPRQQGVEGDDPRQSRLAGAGRSS